MSTHAGCSDLAAATGIYLTDVRAKREPYDLLAPDSLARAELQVTFDRIATRLPGLHMTADVEALPWRTSALVTAPARLPVAW